MRYHSGDRSSFNNMAIGTSLKDESGNEFSDFEIDQSDDRETDDGISDIYEIRRKTEKEKAEDFIERNGSGSKHRGSFLSQGRFNRDFYRLNFELSDSSSEAGFHLYIAPGSADAFTHQVSVRE